MNETPTPLSEVFAEFDAQFPELAGIHHRIKKCDGNAGIAALADEVIEVLRCIPRGDAQDCLVTMLHVSTTVVNRGMRAICDGPRGAQPTIRRVVDYHMKFIVYISTVVVPDASVCVCQKHSLERAAARSERRRGMN